jgi:hypothetical protein
MRNGVSSSSIPPSSQGWSIRAFERGNHTRHTTDDFDIEVEMTVTQVARMVITSETLTFTLPDPEKQQIGKAGEAI